MDAVRLTCSMLDLSGATIIGHAKDGAVNLSGAHIGSELDCTGASLGNASGPALAADSLQVGQSMFLHAGAVTASARATTASLRADLENAKARNHRLDVELTALRRRLSELTGREVLAEISAADAPAATGRVAELDQALFDAQEALGRRTEELEAARQINRELMARLNHGR